MSLASAQAELAKLNSQDYANECSDNLYYSSGRKAAFAKLVREAEAKVAALAGPAPVKSGDELKAEADANIASIKTHIARIERDLARAKNPRNGMTHYIKSYESDLIRANAELKKAIAEEIARTAMVQDIETVRDRMIALGKDYTALDAAA